ncbi:ectoine/hydroxyectoine ABC transporter substrate-binding protein EhuB [Nocardia cyriacigeorgica]|uniref:Ectoine/hydroxyectoine ABC transporter substrate-binding protein EhuB n=1 Tax=Nocardia cyriacigeorgica TaxID=135487 RepID=A0A6P1D0Y1_9NOCA|nr:ectoine/hydroxyectoine ABC transporter substrate-binding protein EhuB [Nocardia cyriacigeorgica]NEW39301.1 ectoine/hydroxyectoine ABC transporter substrate-binding protein EhuB [Nocardia cyriacigeorgica]NEW43229.1 ectoine/hydroxyectoine ABC transporter substrate-binding protein EhuB [Nocardia cyriacigeorgica]NEW49806.1 ectoine/hydroxyectoine ABC transporter substrate-binding protein EhuB [Nocardia cyriacigeorgica]NEW54541.1 ectoine/hydroxyectoine ABC transporter substrate-binding protein Ehu
MVDTHGRLARYAAAFAGATLFAATLAGCTKTDTSADGDLLQSLQDSGTVTVGFAGEAPYSFEQDGQLTGATVALHREIFKNLGIDTVDGVQTEFGALIPGLQAQRFDAVSAGMSILPKRCEQAAFSEPEFMYTTALMVKSGNPMNLTDMQSVKDSGARMAAMTGAIESDYAASLGIDATLVGTPQDGLDAVTSGRADVFALTAISLNWLKNHSPGADVEVTPSFVAVIDGKPQIGAGGTVFRTTDQDLLAAYNAELKKITSDKAKYLSIVGPFGFTERELPDPNMTTEQLCKGEV